MKNILLCLFCALAFSRAAYPITATKAYVDSATNDTLAAAKAYTDTVAGVTPQTVTNIASAVVAPATNALSSVMLPLILERATSNDVNAIIASSNLCTVAAADAKYLDTKNGRITWEQYGIEFSQGTKLKLKDYLWLDDWNNVGVGSQLLPAYLASGAWNTADDPFRTCADNLCHVSLNGWIVTSAPAGVTFSGQPEYVPESVLWFWNDNNGNQWLDDTAHGGDPNATELMMWCSEHGEQRVFAKKRSFATAGRPFVTDDNAPSLSGKTYDFHNGTNFTKNLYTALTNVIQTLGGTVANPPTFD